MRMKAMLALLGLIDRIPDEALQMSCWVLHERNPHNPKHKHPKRPAVGQCGTVACWLGHAALDPVTSNILGLMPHRTRNAPSSSSKKSWDVVLKSNPSILGFAAGANALGISYKEAEALFKPLPGFLPSNAKVKAALRQRWHDLMAARAAKLFD